MSSLPAAVLIDNPTIPEACLKTLHAIRSSGQRLCTLVSDILDAGEIDWSRVNAHVMMRVCACECKMSRMNAQVMMRVCAGGCKITRRTAQVMTCVCACVCMPACVGVCMHVCWRFCIHCQCSDTAPVRVRACVPACMCLRMLADCMGHEPVLMCMYIRRNAWLHVRTYVLKTWLHVHIRAEKVTKMR